MAKKKSKIAVSLFSGAGGMDIGVKAAGFRIAAQVEYDKFCCETLRAAAARENERTVVLESDIREVDPVALRKQLKLKKGEVDLIFGGPPCQSFSQAGKQKGLDDERGMLLFQMIRFAEEFHPKVLMVENVKGLLSSRGATGRKGEVFEKFLLELEDAGYQPKWRVIIAADFGVPQLRERLFIVATRGKKNGFYFPDRTHAPKEECESLLGYQPYVTVGDVLQGLGSPSPKIKGQTFYDRMDGHVDVTPARDRERIAQVPEGSFLAAQTHLGDELRRGLTPKDTTKYLRLHYARPSNTLRCGEIFYHPTEDRYLTPREYMRIHGFPDDYVLVGPIRSRTGTVKNLDLHRQVANSVPPPVARALAVNVMEYLSE